MAVILALFVVLVLAAPSSATWSIVAVDEDTGEVGVAMASCVPASVLGNEGQVLVPVLLAPGVAVGAVQGIADPSLIELAGAELLDRSDPKVIVETLLEQDDLASARQYGFVSLVHRNTATADASSSVPGVVQYTGPDVEPSAGQRAEEGVAVQGGLLSSTEVLDASMMAFTRSREAGSDLATALAEGLSGGARVGGDRRCGAQSALFAQLVVARAFDDGAAPETLLTVIVDEGDGQNPVFLLEEALVEGQTGWLRLGRSPQRGVPKRGVLAVGIGLGLASMLVLWRGMGSPSARRSPQDSLS